MFRKEPLGRFIHWIRERHQIYLRRRAGKPRPWTKDPILRDWFFTNPYRENDKVTRWYRENIREPYRDDPLLPFATIAFRWFNYIPTGEQLLANGLLFDWDTRACMSVLQGRGQIFTGAFNISNSGSTKPKLQRVCEDYIQPLWDDYDTIAEFFQANREGPSGLMEAHRFLGQYPGLGGSGFMAAQVVADLKYTPLLQGAGDWWTWCSPGPGSIRGLNILLGREADAGKAPDFLQKINLLRELVHKALPTYPKFHAQDIQNCCCEFSKMEAVRETGRAKRRYHGGGNGNP